MAVNIDMTLVTNHPLLDPFNTDDQYISIYLGQEHATLRDSITFGRIIKTAEPTGRPSYDMSTETHGKRFHFRQPQGINALGAFRIGVEYEGETHYTSTIVLMHNATITPEQTTLTAHLGETVTILFNTDMMTDTLKWRFNGDSIYGSKGKQSLTLENIQMDKAGLYKCFIQSHRWDADQQAIQLLHIIKCPAYRWGADCEQDCPECLNGGRCDADSGECVCPPGFSGTTCDQVLGSNRFGQNGSFSCDTSGDDHSLACRGKLFCLPDPFGCTCAAGFMGIDCTRECAPGRYGANCLQECHCDPTNICKKDTGECMDGTACADGWTGVNCQGMQAQNPHNQQPVPSFEISSFHYSRVNNGNPTTLVCVVTASPSPPALESISVTYTVNGQLTIIPRQESTANETTRTSRYQITVTLDEMPKNFTCLFRGPDEMILASQDVAVYVFEPPSFNDANNLVRESTSQSITVVWSAWNENRDYGDRPVIGYHVYYNTNDQNDLVRASQNIISDTTYNITGLVHDTEYDIRVTALREGERGEGSYSSPITGSTSCIAPSAAPVLSLRGQTQSSISLSWEVIYDYFIYSYN
nr:tyrosine-protein kinase receptor Tie-1-like [Lytechinus pictus]